MLQALIVLINFTLALGNFMSCLFRFSYYIMFFDFAFQFVVLMLELN